MRITHGNTPKLEYPIPKSPHLYAQVPLSFHPHKRKGSSTIPVHNCTRPTTMHIPGDTPRLFTTIFRGKLSRSRHAPIFFVRAEFHFRTTDLEISHSLLLRSRINHAGVFGTFSCVHLDVSRYREWVPGTRCVCAFVYNYVPGSGLLL